MWNDNRKKIAISSGISCLASATAESASFPIDCVKSNMQVRNKGIIGTVGSMYKEGGIGRFYRGLQPAIMRHWVYTNMRVSIYKPLLDKLNGGKDKNETNVGLRFVTGATAGGVSQFIANPTDLLKVRKQTGGCSWRVQWSYT